MKITLVAKEAGLAYAFHQAVKGLDDVTVFEGSIFDVEADAYVSPANSFGFMDGGIDAWYTWRFGASVQDNVRMAILKHWQGELPVGAAEIASTADDEVPFMIAAPTMRVPKVLGSDSINSYLAMRAAIMCVRSGRFKDGPFEGQAISDHVKSIVVPGLGTGVGKVPFSMAAFQMCEAIRLHATGRHFLPKSWSEATDNHLTLLGQDPRNLQKD